jgi:glycerol-3-phosphate dehydrogenase
MNRADLLDRLRTEPRWDLIVIGGGATGLGAAVDAAARGYTTLLVEAHDFAQGTSSRSTKLIHGGVRYLAQGNLSLVREALHERAVLERNAPHLVASRSFVVPAYSWFALPFYGTGLKLYDLLAGRQAHGRSWPVSASRALRLAPTLRARGLKGGIVYHDGQFDDARMVVALVRTLTDLGGTALNYLPVVGLRKEAGKVAGVVARDAETGEEFAVAARAVINATGVYADAVRALDQPEEPRIIRPSRGAHLVLPRRFLPGDTAVMVPKTDDGRVLFAIPWHSRVVLGTTDTPVDGPPPEEPIPSADEFNYLLRHAARYLDPAPTADDVLSQFAGLRPLIDAHKAHQSTARLSREHAVIVSGTGLVTITGGKWTTYRRMGADAVERAAAVAGLEPRPCRTADLALHGAPDRDAAPVGFGATDDPLAIYGTEADAVRRLAAERPEWSPPIDPRLPYLAAEVVWAARHEAARTVEDVLSRRTRALLLDARAAREAAPTVAALLAEVLGRDTSWQEDQVRRFRELSALWLPSQPADH